MEEKEPSYAIDSIDMNTDQWTYLEECGQIDTRLIKYYTEDGQYLILRPAPIGSDRRLSNCGHTDLEIAKIFPNLVDEMNYCDIKVPDYKMFISNIHTVEGHTGESLCIASRYIHGRCLPLDFNGHWFEKQALFYTALDNWLGNITNYISYKYLSANKESYFLSDVFRPIQFVYSFEDKDTYLVDLDPLYENTLDDNKKLNKRFLVGIQTVNNYRNAYLNRLRRTDIDLPQFGHQSQEQLIKLTDREDFLESAVYDEESKRIVRNLQQRLHYKKSSI